jgi:hypothetical protein
MIEEGVQNSEKLMFSGYPMGAILTLFGQKL